MQPTEPDGRKTTTDVIGFTERWKIHKAMRAQTLVLFIDRQ